MIDQAGFTDYPGSSHYAPRTPINYPSYVVPSLRLRNDIVNGLLPFCYETKQSLPAAHSIVMRLSYIKKARQCRAFEITS